MWGIGTFGEGASHLSKSGVGIAGRSPAPLLSGQKRLNQYYIA